MPRRPQCCHLARTQGGSEPLIRPGRDLTLCVSYFPQLKTPRAAPVQGERGRRRQPPQLATAHPPPSPWAGHPGPLRVGGQLGRGRQGGGSWTTSPARVSSGPRAAWGRGLAGHKPADRPPPKQRRDEAVSRRAWPERCPHFWSESWDPRCLGRTWARPWVEAGAGARAGLGLPPGPASPQPSAEHLLGAESLAGRAGVGKGDTDDKVTRSLPTPSPPLGAQSRQGTQRTMPAVQHEPHSGCRNGPTEGRRQPAAKSPVTVSTRATEQSSEHMASARLPLARPGASCPSAPN